MIFFDRSNFQQHYHEITDQTTIRNINIQYRLLEKDYKLVSNKDYPIIFGSLTNGSLCQMADVALFNLFLDNRKIRKEFGAKNSSNVMNNVINISQGIKSKFGKQISLLTQDDWVRRLYNNLPYNKEDILICNLSLDEESKQILSNPKHEISKEVYNERQRQSTEDIFVFAGFIKPGKQQIFIKDPATGKIYGRELVIDIRRREVDCRKYLFILS